MIWFATLTASNRSTPAPQRCIDGDALRAVLGSLPVATSAYAAVRIRLDRLPGLLPPLQVGQSALSCAAHGHLRTTTDLEGPLTWCPGRLLSKLPQDDRNRTIRLLALDLVGSRLRRVREQRGLTLTDAAGQTGISKSTLSRLETGQRRPSLELLLPLAQVYRVPIDDLVGAPVVGDPRIRLKPRRVNGRMVLPLTRPGGIQAWKIVVPASQTTPTPRTHDGFEWLYVLSGRLRLLLGDQDLVLAVGEAVEFDTRVPHWFGSTGDGSAEVLSIFGRPGERMLVRASDGADAEPHQDPHLE